MTVRRTFCTWPIKRQRQELHEFQSSLGYMVRPRLKKSILKKIKIRNKEITCYGARSQSVPFAGLNIPVSASHRSRMPRRPHCGPRVAPTTPALVPAEPRGLHTHRTPGSRPAAITPEVALGARLRGGESCNRERLLVSYARSPAHQGSTSGSLPPPRCYGASTAVG